jgi:hypothetical protein
MFRRALHVTCVFAALYVVAATLSATTLNRATYFAFNKPVRVTGVLLPPGDYVFEIANPTTASNVVRISDRKKSKVYVSALTRSTVRPSTKQLDPVIVFGEESPTTPRTIHAWYPAGVTTGYEFLK